MAAIGAAAKWGRWDHVESLLEDLQQLGLGERGPGRQGREEREATDPGRPEGQGLRIECYAYLVEAYAHASLWSRTIAVYRDHLVTASESDRPLQYQVTNVGSRSGYPTELLPSRHPRESCSKYFSCDERKRRRAGSEPCFFLVSRESARRRLAVETPKVLGSTCCRSLLVVYFTVEVNSVGSLSLRRCTSLC